MGSTYRPPRRDRGYGQERDRYNDPPPPPPPRHGDYQGRRENGYKDSYDRGSHYQPSYSSNQSSERQSHQDNGRGHPRSNFTFRGAASQDHGGASRAEERFTFQAPPNGPAALRFPSGHEQPLPPRPPRRGNDIPQRGNRDRRGPGRPGDAGKPRRFGPRPAHARDLLTRSAREVTPEQLAGMNADSQPRFRDVEEYFSGSDDSDDNSVGLGEDGEVTHKRRKVVADAEVAQPKWSNPDPYTALPPPSQSGAPKKDIVETIRKAKIDQSLIAAAKNPVKDNIDFISFEDDDEIEIVSVRDTQESEDDQDFRIRSGRGRKRRHSEVSQDHSPAGTIVEEWETDGYNPTPWCPIDQSYTAHVGLKLHKEIADFYEYVKPLPSETRIRQDIALRIQNAIQGWYQGRGVQIFCFGSFPAGLFLPTADMDLVALSPRYLASADPSFCLSMPDKRKLRNVLRSAGIFDPVLGADIVGFAKVPLIKFADLQTGLKVDISFENRTGIDAQKTLHDWKQQFPDMPILVALIKQFLAMRNLNEVFHGGIGGFTIICLVVSMLQHMPESQANSMEPHTRYGELLMNFFDLYGNKFNYFNTGIIMEPPSYFDKQKDANRIGVRYQEDRLTIIDPNRADNDISGGSRLIREVFACFKGAYSLMQRRLDQMRKGDADNGSILGCILGGNYASYVNTRAKLQRVYERNYPDDPHSHALGPPPPLNMPELPLSKALPPKPPKLKSSKKSAGRSKPSSKRPAGHKGPSSTSSKSSKKLEGPNPPFDANKPMGHKNKKKPKKPKKPKNPT